MSLSSFPVHLRAGLLDPDSEVSGTLKHRRDENWARLMAPWVALQGRVTAALVAKGAPENQGSEGDSATSYMRLYEHNHNAQTETTANTAQHANTSHGRTERMHMNWMHLGFESVWV